jgi:hypothetical protein
MSQDTARPKRRRVLIYPVSGSSKSGRTTIGGTQRNESDANQTNCTKVTIAADTYVSISVYGLWTGGSQGNLAFAIYDDDGAAGIPGTLLAQTMPPVGGGLVGAGPVLTPRWATLPLQTPITLAAGTYYIAVKNSTSGRSWNWYYDTGSSGDSYEDSTDATATLMSNFNAAWAASTTASKQLSAYLNSASGSFQPPRSPMLVLVTIVGAGGGGGGASRVAASPARRGAGGGGAGEAVWRHPYYVSAISTIVIGTGYAGVAGPGATVNGNSGDAGDYGDQSQFGSMICRGGLGGNPEIAGGGGGTGGASGGGTAGGAGGNTGTAGVTGANNVPILPGGGGGGGSGNNGVAPAQGAVGGATIPNMAAATSTNALPANGGVGGIKGGTTASDSGGGGGGGGTLLGFGGNGGAGAASGTAGAVGVAGTGFGSGGGGAGGQAATGTNGNAGGAGANGIVIVEWDE